MKRFIKYTFFFLVPTTSSAIAGKYAGASMELGIGVRAMALGNAATAMSGQAELFYFNPASLGFVMRPVLNLMYAPSFGSLKSPLANYNHIGGAFPLPGGGTVGLNWTRFAVDEIPIYPDLKGTSFADRNRDISLRPDGTALGTFADTEDVVYFSFSKMINKNMPLGWLFIDLPVEIPFGINLKLFQQRIYENKASSMGIDLGTMFRFHLGTLLDQRHLGFLTFGLSYADVTQTTIVWDTQHQDRIKRTAMFGMAYEHSLGKWGQAKLFWTSYQKYNNHNLYGAEFAIKNLSLRIGKNQTGLTAGAGFRIWKLVVDYAFVASDLDNLNRIGCSVIF